MNILPLFLMTFFVAMMSVIIKIIADRLPKIVALFVQYFFCAMYIATFWAFFDRTMSSVIVFLFIALVIGFLNYMGVYCQWTAYRINMARTSLFSPLSGVLTIILFWIFFREYKDLSPIALAGVCLHLVAIWMFILARRKHPQVAGKGNVGKWLLCTLVMVVTHGVINFLMKTLSQDVSKTHFLLCWYVGTFVFSALFLPFDKSFSVRSFCEQKKVFLFVPLCSVAIMGYLVSLYWAFQTSSGTLVASYSALNSTFVPAVMGWLFFKEAKGVGRGEIAGLTCGIVAAVLIIASH